MISSFRRSVIVAGGVLCLGLAGAALAQSAAPPPPAGGHPDAGQHPWRDPAQREAERAKRLGEILQLRPDQQGALQAYLDATKHDHMGRHHGMDGDHMAGSPGGAPGPDQAVTTPQRLDAMLAHVDDMRAHLVTRIAATKAFYAQLSPQQQQAFDAMGGGFGHHGGGHDWRGGQRGGPGREGPPGGPPQG